MIGNLDLDTICINASRTSSMDSMQAANSELDKAIRLQIVRRTGARIKKLEVEIVKNAVIIRGCAPCYYVKQLALQGVLDVLGPFRTIRVELNVYVPEATMPVVDS